MALGLKRFLPTGFPDVVEDGVVYKEGDTIILVYIFAHDTVKQVCLLHLRAGGAPVVQDGLLVQRTARDSFIIHQNKFIKEVVINNKRSVFLHILKR